MKKFYIALLMIAMCSISNAQWEKVGFPGGVLDDVYQFGDLMVGIYGNHVYRSTDDGDHWTSFDEGLPQSNFILYYGVYIVNDTLVIKPNFISYNSGVSYMKTYYFIIKDNSTSWQETQQWLFSSSSAFGISKDSVFAIGTYAEAVTNGGVFGFTSDGGQTWNERRNGIPGRELFLGRYYISGKKVIVDVSYTDSLYLTDSTFTERNMRAHFVTTDLGEHWEKLIPSITDSLYQSEGLYQVDSAKFVFLGTSYGLESLVLYSSNAGDTWERPSGIDAQMWWGSTITTLSDSLLFMTLKDQTVSDTLSKCYVSYNSGKSWTRKNELTFEDDIYRIYERKVHDDGYLLRMFRSDDQYLILDTSFSIVGTATFDGLMNTRASAALINDEKIIATTNSDSIFVSTDNGENWHIEHTQEPKLAGGGWLEGNNNIYRLKNNNGYSYSWVLKSSNMGISWDTVHLPIEFYSSFSMSVSHDTLVMIVKNPETGYLTTFLSPDQGTSWESIRIPYYDLYSGHAIYNDVKDIYFVSTQADYYYFSNDYGRSWDSIGVAGLTIPENQIESKSIYVSNDWIFSYGYRYDSSAYFIPFILRCKRNLSEWELLETNLSDSVVPTSMVQIGKYLFMLSLSYNDLINNDGTCRLFRSEDNGLTWEQIGETLYDGYRLHYNNKYLFVSGRYGLYRYPLALAGIHDSKTNSNNSLSLSAYPNPATNELTISHTSERAERVVMYDMTGALIRSGTVIGEQTWDVSALPSGSYMLGIPGGKMQVVQIVN